MSLSPRTLSPVVPSPEPLNATPQLVVVLWSMFGARRLYVDTPDRRHVGWVDLNTGHRSLVMTELADAFDAAVAEAEATGAPRRALEEAIESALIDGLAAQDGTEAEPEAEPEPLASLLAPSTADRVAETVFEEASAMRHAYRDQQAFSDWDRSARGIRLVPDGLDGPALARWAYQNSAIAERDTELAHRLA